MTDPSKLETLLKKRSVAEIKIERVCAKISKSIKDVNFDQADATSLQERLALAFAEFANIKDEVMTLDDMDMEEESTHYGRFEDMCDAGKKKIYNATAKLEKKVATSEPSSSFAASSASEKSVKLPKLGLPSFPDATLNGCRLLIFLRPQSIQTEHCPMLKNYST